MVTGQSGVTLIELLIAILIIGLLILVAAPYTTSWVHESDLNHARAQLSRAHSEAKALALRNPGDKKGNDAAAALNRVGDHLIVCDNRPCTTDNAIWQEPWRAGVDLTLRVGATEAEEICLNNRGQVLTSCTLGDPLHSGLTYELSKGNVSYGNDENEDNRLR